MPKTNDDIQQFLSKVKKMEKGEKLDLSSDEDLSIGIMNLISMEEHFFFTYSKTDDPVYLDLLNEVREMRKELLKRIIKDYEGEVWCISKHLLAASYRLMEVGNKDLSSGKKDEAYDLFNKAYELYSLFWGLNMKLINPEDIKHIDDKAINKHDHSNKSLIAKLGDLVKRAINCCIE